MHRTRTGRHIALTVRDTEIFRLLDRYRYLRSTYIHSFVGGASETRFKERLGDLFHEGYLDRPTQQWEFFDARYRPVVHELGAGAKRVLWEHSNDNQGCALLGGEAQRQFRHSLMICETLASLELSVRANVLRFISRSEILAKAPEATRASPAPFRLPLPSGGHLVPDGLFGIEYRTGGAKSYRFFALEADRGTMPLARTARAQTSYIAKLEAYRDVIDSNAHRSYWGIPNLLLLTLTTSARRLDEMLSRVDRSTSSSAFLFKALGDFALIRPAVGLLTEPWMRAGLPPLSIAESS
jgi:hypothetical protein